MAAVDENNDKIIDSSVLLPAESCLFLGVTIINAYQEIINGR